MPGMTLSILGLISLAALLTGAFLACSITLWFLRPRCRQCRLRLPRLPIDRWPVCYECRYPADWQPNTRSKKGSYARPSSRR